MTALGPSRFMPFLDIPPTMATALLLVLAYALGVMFDRVWDFLLDAFGLQIWFRGGPQASGPSSYWEKKRRRVFGADAKTAVEFVNYHRTRVRVARASLFNFTLIALSGMALLLVRFGGIATLEFALVGLTGALLCAASALALRNLGRGHDRVLVVFSVEEEGEHKPPASIVQSKSGED